MSKSKTTALPISAEDLEFVDALANAPRDDGETSEEIAERLGVVRETVHRKLRRLAKQGRLVIGKAMRERALVPGTFYPCPVYRIRKDGGD